MDEERLMILKMLQEGKISADEAANLLDALDSGKDSKKTGGKQEEKSSGKPGRWFRVVVTDSVTGRVRTNIRIPLGVINAGVKMGAHFAPQMTGMSNEEILKAVQSGITGQILDVYDEEDGERVEVFIE
jgi:hypothetical protein